jgi:Flp pilus assembly protein TadG
VTHFLVTAMDIVSIFKRSRPSASARSADESIKFERSGQSGLYDKDARPAWLDTFSSGVPVILRSILLPLHACGLSRVPEPHFSGDVMIGASIFNQVRSSAARFRRAERGNVAVLFAIAVVPILGFVGGAIDYSRVNNARTAMQAALDTAALMISKDATSSLTAAQINQQAQAYFNALYKHPEAQGVVVNATYTNSTSQGSQIVLKGSAKMATDFMKVVGYPSLDFGASSTTVWGTTKLRVALALDNTGSMASAGKMAALKTAATNLLDTLKTAAKTDGDVYVSIVPFAKDVNIDTANKSAKWLRWDLGQCTNKNNGSALGFMTKTDCNNLNNSKWTATTKGGWTGCVSDRDNTPTPGYDTLSTAPSDTVATDPTASKLATQFPAENYPDCPTAIMPLSYDWTTLKAKVDDMDPQGNTNQAIGMAWGWLSLLQQSPLNAPAEDPNFQYSKVIVLLSDGDNTQNRFSSSASQIDARQKLLCDNIKSVKDPKTGKSVFTIYTIQVNTANDNTSSVMSYCASSSNTYFSTTTAAGINTAFNSIGSALSKLRIAK